jgi:hypothetical protein
MQGMIGMKLRMMTLMTAAALLLAGRASAREPTIVVARGDAQDLYAKLADPATAGHTLFLSGTYRLTPEGSGAKTSGYLELGDRHLRGENVMLSDADGVPVAVDPAGETVIDGSGLVAEPEPLVVSDGLPAFTRSRALIRASQGNVIEGLTVIWPAPGTFGPGGAIRLLAGTGGRVTSCHVIAFGIGIFVNNAGKAAEGTVLVAEVSENLVTRQGAHPGILITNLLTRDARTRAYVDGNRVQGGAGTGHLRIQNQNSTTSVLDVTTTRNRFVAAPVAGVEVYGGNAVLFRTIASSGNRASWTSTGDWFERNATAILLRAGSINGDDNTIQVRIKRARFTDNQVTINVAGHDGIGSGNRARLLVRQSEQVSGGPVEASHQIGSDGVDNVVSVIGNPNAWIRTNRGLPLPADPADPSASFFTGD